MPLFAVVNILYSCALRLRHWNKPGESPPRAFTGDARYLHGRYVPGAHCPLIATYLFEFMVQMSAEQPADHALSFYTALFYATFFATPSFVSMNDYNSASFFCQ